MPVGPLITASNAGRMTAANAKTIVTFCQLQYLRLSTSQANMTFTIEPSTNVPAGEAIVAPRSAKAGMPSVWARIWSVGGRVNWHSAQALKPIQKKISQMAWFQPRIQPMNGWIVRDVNT